MISNKIKFSGNWHRASGNIWPNVPDRNSGDTPAAAIRAPGVSLPAKSGLKLTCA
jgi:hypothetical protein